MSRAAKEKQKKLKMLLEVRRMEEVHAAKEKQSELKMLLELREMEKEITDLEAQLKMGGNEESEVSSQPDGEVLGV